jgi:lipid II:glycine glycyltransferase (peptidoglycan interpeptide bridge formation enzyme)
VEVMRARFPPGSRILRLPRFGRGRSVLEVTRAVRGLRELAERPQVVRAHVEIWSEKESERIMVARACEAEGFRRIQPRMYPRTLWIDIGVDEDEILGSFHATARRHIRAPAKKGFRTVPLTDPRHASRLEELHQASFLRSGGEAPFVDWSATLEAARRHPDRVAVRGVTRVEEPEKELLSFAVAVRNDDVAEYLHAGLVRRDDLRVPLLYAPTWALMRWAREHGARWWDFGGITSGSAGDDDPRGGISDFKRYFRGEVREVGDEWVYEPDGVAAGLARAANRVRTRILA